MDKSEYIHLLSEASINDTSKFRPVSSERPKTRGRPSKHYHPLLAKEVLVKSTITRILPHDVAQSLCPTGSRLAHLYGLPKTHKEKLAMRPILSATNTYNYALAKWLDTKLKPLLLNQPTFTGFFDFEWTTATPQHNTWWFTGALCCVLIVHECKFGSNL